jgi:Fe-S cluster assembly ATPase SufC
MVHLDDASKTVVKQRIVEFRLLLMGYDHSGDSTLTTLIAGSKVMKKLILDGVDLRVEDQSRYQVLGPIKIVKEACKKKEIELWKENFEVGNGKVDLEK